jgi:hypothetical protein
MIRNLKVLGLALVAVFAMSAVAASASSAAQFHSEGANTTFSGGQTTQHRFGTTTGTVICSTASFSGEAANATEESLTITPVYSGCEFEELFEVTVNTNGCKYTFHASSATNGTVDIKGCGTNKYIQVGSTLTCRVRVPEQNGISAVMYTNEGSGANRKVLVTAEVTNLRYEESGLFCANSGTSMENGTYTGSTLVSGNQGGVWVE